jgi:RNA polymerase sigma factor (sigma-70 family)
MSRDHIARVLHQLRRVIGPGSSGALSDGELLECFVREQNESAFELLLRRHAALVMKVCWGVLRNNQDAEDAFQATFLILARKAAGIGRGEAVVAWLHRVAYRTALRARARAAQRVAREERSCSVRTSEVPVGPEEEAERRELRRLLDAEVNRLPDKCRAAVVLCCLEGKSYEEAARLLGCPRGSVSNYLRRGRELLHGRLMRCGLAPLRRPARQFAGLRGARGGACRAECEHLEGRPALPGGAARALGGGQPGRRGSARPERGARSFLTIRVRGPPDSCGGGIEY